MTLLETINRATGQGTAEFVIIRNPILNTKDQYDFIIPPMTAPKGFVPLFRYTREFNGKYKVKII